MYIRLFHRTHNTLMNCLFICSVYLLGQRNRYLVFLSIIFNQPVRSKIIIISSAYFYFQHFQAPYKAAGLFLFWIIKYLFRCSFLINLTLIHIKDPVADGLGKRHFVSDDHHGFSAFSQRFYYCLNFANHSRIKGTCRFIQ